MKGLRLWSWSWRLLVSGLRLGSKWAWFPQHWDMTSRLAAPPLGPFTLWAHGASLGESKALAQILEHVVWAHNPQARVLVTYQTAAAHQMWQAYPDPRRTERYFPGDCAKLLETWISSVQPQAVWLIESELWPNFLTQILRAKIPVHWLGARLGPGLRRWWTWDPRGLGQLLGQLNLWPGTLADAQLCRDWGLPIRDQMDLKSLAPLPPRSQGRGFALLSWRLADLEFGLQLLARAREEILIVQPRQLRELPQFRQALVRAGWTVVDWPQVQSGALSLVGSYGATSAVLAQCCRSAVGGGRLGGHPPHDPRESMAAGLRTWVGPHTGADQQLWESWMRQRGLGIEDQPEYQPSGLRARRLRLLARAKVMQSFKTLTPS